MSMVSSYRAGEWSGELLHTVCGAGVFLECVDFLYQSRPACLRLQIESGIVE